MDRISNLPDEVLCHVLSFVKTKQAAVTSSLSKRWVNVWTLVPNLDINDSVFLHPEEDKFESDEVRESFVDFMEKVLAMQSDCPVKKFSLKCITGVHPDCVNRWICKVMQRGVSDLQLFIDFSADDIKEGYTLPVEMFVSSTLVELKITSDVDIDWWRDGICNTFLPKLKTLVIDSELFKCGELETFLPSFPILEEVRMALIQWIDPDVTISSASLRTLSIHADGCNGFGNPKSISFNTPSLLSLSYIDVIAEDYPLVNMKNLTQATIKLILYAYQIQRIRAPDNDLLENEDDEVILQCRNVVKLMNGIQNVQKLCLLPDTLEVLSVCCESMPVFKNLKTLDITSEKIRGWQAMPVLLRNCPHLDTIIFQGLLHHVTDKCGDACPCIPREDKGCSLKSCPVKLLEIYEFRAMFEEMLMIKNFLEYFPSLEVLRVYVKEYDLTKPKFQAMSNLFDAYSNISDCDIQIMIPHVQWRN